MLFRIDETDLTGFVENGSYSVENKKEYEEWKDGNYISHRIYTRNRIGGTLNIICSPRTIDKDDFLTLLSENTHDNLLSCLVYVANEDRMEAIDCFYSIKAKNFKPKSVIYELTLEEA